MLIEDPVILHKHRKRTLQYHIFDIPSVSSPHSHPPSIYPEETSILKAVLSLPSFFFFTRPIHIDIPQTICYFMLFGLELYANGPSLDPCVSFFQTYIFPSFLHGCSCILFIFTVVRYSNVWIYYNRLSFLLLVRYLGCFHSFFLTISNGSLMNSYPHIVSPDKYIGVK